MPAYRVLITASAEREMDALPRVIHGRVSARVLGLEMWTGLLLKGGRCLGITRKLFSENMEFFSSQPALELAEIRYAVEFVREAFS